MLGRPLAPFFHGCEKRTLPKAACRGVGGLSEIGPNEHRPHLEAETITLT